MNLLEHELLGYKRFTIYQHQDLFKFTIDSILLSGFIKLKETDKTIIDLGTGNAVIPIYLTMKTNALIYGIEIQKETYELGLKSVKKNKLDRQIKLINDDIKNLPELFKGKEFAVVTCNPPYFKYHQATNTNKNDSLTIARHEVSITIKEIIEVSLKILKDKGVFYIIYRPDRLVDLISLMREYKIEPKIVRFVYPNKAKQANHVLVKGVKGGKPGSLKVLPALYIYQDNNDLTKEILEIYNYGRNDYASK